MICLACRRLDSGPLCPGCSGGLRGASDRLLPDGLRVRSAYIHKGPARALVHALKYRGIGHAGQMLAEAMGPLVPADVVLVPLTRVRWRQFTYGVDPARELTRRLASELGLEYVDLLSAPWLSPAQAQVSRSNRRPPMFTLRRPSEFPVALIDDVVTTGGTIEHAHRLIGPSVVLAVTATSSGGD